MARALYGHSVAQYPKPCLPRLKFQVEVSESSARRLAFSTRKLFDKSRSPNSNHISAAPGDRQRFLRAGMNSSTETWRVNWLMAIKAAAFVLLVPGIVVVAIRLLILSVVHGGVGFGSTPWKFVGSLGLLGGGAVYLICLGAACDSRRRNPPPVQPTNNLVQTGPYGNEQKSDVYCWNTVPLGRSGCFSQLQFGCLHTRRYDRILYRCCMV